MILFFDTETTGLVEPRLVQLGMILCTDGLETVSEACLLVKPAKVIEDGAIKAHDITNEFAQENGLEINAVLLIFNNALAKTNLVVGHNIKYDMGVLNNELTFIKHPTFCTMQACTPICKLPSTKSWAKGYKWPKLEEAYKILTGKTLEGAHNALTDCRATLEIYKALKSKESIEKVVDEQYRINSCSLVNTMSKEELAKVGVPFIK